ncbi:unnamed protein product [Paramecium octaurelia]|uniref:Uncharacterized protein n=1 Tax=Paramecium octaurelia TaxID=43137 RepID=A0A8S1SHF7_PAROT|nr:unnamed protein product [Paramecium octaurelia]
MRTTDLTSAIFLTDTHREIEAKVNIQLNVFISKSMLILELTVEQKRTLSQRC